MAGEITVTETVVSVNATTSPVVVTVTPAPVAVTTTNQGIQGASGSSGVIAVTAPITNSGTSTSANIGINQSAIAISGTQITSGTIDSARIPTLNQNTTGTASNVTGTVAVANGGTGKTTLTSGQVVVGNGTGAVTAIPVTTNGSTASALVQLDALGNLSVASGSLGRISAGTGGITTTGNITTGAGKAVNVISTGGGTSVITAQGAANLSLPAGSGTLALTSGNITGTAANVTGTVAITNGGTGATTASTALTNLGAVATTSVGAVNGVASLDGSGLIPTSQLPPLAISDTFVVASQAAMLALTAQVGDVAVRTDINQTFILQATPPTTLGNWIQILTPPAITSITAASPLTGGTITSTGTIGIDDATTTVKGAVQLTDSTSSTSTTTAATPNSVKTVADSDALKAPLASPALTGTPTTPTATVDTNTTQVASTAFVLGQASATTPVIDGTATIGTATTFARADHIHPTDTSRAAVSGQTFTGAITAPNITDTALNTAGIVTNTSAGLLGTVTTVPVANGGTGQTAIPVATAWVSGTTYAVGDIVETSGAYYVRRVAGAGTTSPALDATNWAVRSLGYNSLGAFTTAGKVVAFSADAGTSNTVAVQGLRVGTSGSFPTNSSGITSSNGSITVTGTGNGVTVTGTGGVSAGSGGITTTGSISATSTGNLNLGTSGSTGGSIVFANASGTQTLQASLGTGTQTLPITAGTLLNNSSTIGISQGGTGVTTGLTVLNGANITAASINLASMNSVTGIGSTAVSDVQPIISNPQIVDAPFRFFTGPSAVTTTITATQLLNSLVTSAPSTTQSTSLPTATTLNAVWIPTTNGYAVEWSYINTGTGLITVTASAGSTNTIATGNNATIVAGTSGRFLTRKTGTSTYVTYRLA